MFIIALLAALWHLGWVLILWNAAEPMLATPIAPYYILCGSSRCVALALLLISLWTLFAKWVWPRGLMLGLALLPQQATLMASAASAAHAVVSGHYADSVPRPREFIFADQWGNIIPALLHTAYVVWVFAAASQLFNGNSSECKAANYCPFKQ